MKKTITIKMLMGYVVMFGSVSLAPYAVADSAFSWGHWDGGKDQALAMTANQPGTSLNYGTECLHGSCALDLDNQPGVIKAHSQSDTLVACDSSMPSKQCQLGLTVSQQ